MLKYEHGNRKCTGASLEIDATPATGKRDGFFTLTMRPQVSVAADGDGEHPEFGDNAEDVISADLSAKHIAHLLCVLEGDSANVRGGRGISLKQPECGTVAVYIDAVQRPFDGFEVHMKRVAADGSIRNLRITLSIAEGMALKESVKSAMGRMVFVL